jgi:excisionase family DNA binding protein
MEILTVEEAAARLKVEANTVRRMLKSGRLRGRKLGKAWRIPESELQRVVGLAPDAPSITSAGAEADQQTIDNDIIARLYRPSTPGEIARDLALMAEFAALAEKWTKNTPPLADDAVERVYREREDAQL